jgi:hypothetical protein
MDTGVLADIGGYAVLCTDHRRGWEVQTDNDFVSDHSTGFKRYSAWGYHPSMSRVLPRTDIGLPGSDH